MESKRLSIIIPFYNVEHYIAECLDSVFQQDIPEEEYEVVCVNDGSPDHSRNIVLEYQKRHPYLVLVEHKVNKKLGAARNTGRAVAKGNYIWNVDSDDKIVPNCLGNLLRICEENDLDVLDFGRYRFWGENIEDMPNIRSTEEVTSGLDYLEQLESYDLSKMCVVWRRLVRRAFLNENQIFSPEINFGEDVPYSFKVLLSAKRMMAIPDRCYLYRTNPDSLTGTNWVPTPQMLYEKCFQNSRLIYDVVMEVPEKYANVRELYLETARYTLGRYVSYVPKMSLEDRKIFKSICRKAVFTNSYLRELLSLKQYVYYWLWLSGLKSLPE